MEYLLARINKLATWQVAIIIAVVGFAVFFTGLASPFIYDDNPQIVNSPVVHSLSNIDLFFEGSTFYNGGGHAPLYGQYYRPLMTTVFSLLYSAFGLHTIPFHIFLLLLGIANAILLYRFFKYSFNTVLALVFALVFLVHPVNSQILFSLTTRQDALFLFFGMLALLSLMRFRSVRSLVLAAVCIFLSLLAKETGILFVAMAALYLFWFDRKRLLPFVYVMTLPLVLYLVLKIHAVGLNERSTIAAIDGLGLGGRLMTIPAIILFYITKFVFPLQLATGYYWVYPTFSFNHVLLPLVIDLAVISSAVYVALVIQKRLTRAAFYSYLFFGAWAALGLLTHVQIIPLDFTASETWVYFPMVGVLGMLGVVLMVFQKHVRPSWIFIICVILITMLGSRTALRGLDWQSDYRLTVNDISVSKEHYTAYNAMAHLLLKQGKYTEAKAYAEHSVSLFPTCVNYDNLGVALTGMGDYSGAAKAINQGMRYGNIHNLYEDGAVLMLITEKSNLTRQLYLNALKVYPQDTLLWMYLAIFDDRLGDNADAQIEITKAVSLDTGEVPQSIYENIMGNRSFRLIVVNRIIQVN